MTSPPQHEPSTNSGELKAFKTLHLSPTAPQELVVEAYWHLVREVQKSGGGAHAASRLHDLNKAYAALTRSYGGGRQRAARAGERRSIVEQAKRLMPRFGRARMSIAVARNPWEELRLEPGAPPDLVDIAYRFWQVRLRSQWYDAGGAELRRLEDAYKKLHTGTFAARAAAPPEPTVAPVRFDDLRPEPVAEAQEVAPPASGAGVLSSLERGARAVFTKGEKIAAALAGTPPPLPDRERGASAASEERLVEARIANEVTESVPAPAPSTAINPASNGQEAPAQAATTPATSTAEAAAAHASAVAPAAEETGSLPVMPAPQAHGSAASGAYLLIEQGNSRGERISLGQTPIALHAEPDVTTGNPEGASSVAARVWMNESRALLHVITPGPSVLLNDREVVWAILEPGDRLTIGNDVLRFDRVAPARP